MLDTVINWSLDAESHFSLVVEDTVYAQQLYKLLVSVQLGVDDSSGGAFIATSFLPEPTVSNIKKIEKILANTLSNTIVPKLRLSNIIDMPFILKCLELFQLSEELESEEEMLGIYKIISLIFAYSSENIAAFFLSEPVFFDVVHLLEYSVSVSDDGKSSLKRTFEFTKFLQEESRWINVFEGLNDNNLKAMALEIYRAQFFRDYVLAKVLKGGLDDLYAIIGSIIRTKTIDLLDCLEGDPHFVDMFRKMLDSPDRHAQVILPFLAEFLSMLKNTSRNQDELCKLFDPDLIIEVCTSLLSAENFDPSSTTCSQILEFMTQLASSVLSDLRDSLLKDWDTRAKTTTSRTTKLQQHTVPKLLPELVEILLTTNDIGILLQASNLLRIFLVPLATNLRNEDYLNILYPSTVLKLFTPLSKNSPFIMSISRKAIETTDGSPPEDRAEDLSRLHAELICQLSSLLVTVLNAHSFRIKYIMLEFPLVEGIINLLGCVKDKIVLVNLVKVVKAMTVLDDQFYNRFIIKHALFLPLFLLLEANLQSDNALTSSILSIFESTINEKKNLQILKHLNVEFTERLHTLSKHFSTFARLISKFKEESKQELDQMEVSVESLPTATNDPVEEEYYASQDMELEEPEDTAPRDTASSVSLTTSVLPPIVATSADPEEDDGFGSLERSPIVKCVRKKPVSPKLVLSSSVQRLIEAAPPMATTEDEPRDRIEAAADAEASPRNEN